VIASVSEPTAALLIVGVFGTVSWGLPKAKPAARSASDTRPDRHGARVEKRGTMTSDRRATLVAALSFLAIEPHEPELQLLHRCFDTWHGIGDIVAGMARQEYDLELRRYDPAGDGAQCSSRAGSSTRSCRTPRADRHRVHGKPSSTLLGMRSTSSRARILRCGIGLRRTNHPAEHLWYTPRPSMGGRKNSNDVDRCISGRCVGRCARACAMSNPFVSRTTTAIWFDDEAGFVASARGAKLERRPAGQEHERRRLDDRRTTSLR